MKILSTSDQNLYGAIFQWNLSKTNLNPKKYDVLFDDVFSITFPDLNYSFG